MFIPFKILAAVGLAVSVGAQSSTTSSAKASGSGSATSASQSVASTNATGTTSAPATATSATYGFTPCVTSCMTQGAAAAGCSTYFNLQCTCLSSSFNSTLTSCLQASCTAAEQNSSASTQSESCAFVTAAGLSTSITGPNAKAKGDGISVKEAKLVNVLWGVIAFAGALMAM
ncbi:hypothetical protein FIBSPDRAFT_873829 [Athelia psychrophila]|uniref:CFEM domain-containing protein n=1 Tax=Athelia psychrophila TaxID=1759441 RepID=A0A165Y564_9AGAM|nr:hypothetical protein FIBSPDRAFT_873829 [Fibularhizoctonia sp. CBS 109695]